ncbi:MAG: AIR synthase related protein, partial [Bacteroidota bacterium]
SSSPNIASKKWVYRQYDRTVRTNTFVQCTSDAAVMRLKGTKKALAVKTDCNSRYVYLNPRRGAIIAVAESARNVVCSGARPIAITNCLNFGDPYKPDVYWQFEESVKGMAEASSVLETPVTGGNVSFYNESLTTSVYPTPVIGMLGIVEDLDHVTSAMFKSEGDLIVLLGETKGELGGSEYLAWIHGKVAGDAPKIDLQYEKNLQRVCFHAIRQGIVRSAHDVSEGGLGTALAECCVLDEPRDSSGPLGAIVRFDYGTLRPDVFLFGEDQSRIITTVKPEDLQRMGDIASSHGVNVAVIGEVQGINLQINKEISVPVSQLAEVYLDAIERVMNLTVEEKI